MFFLNGAAIALEKGLQTTVSLNSAEDEVKDMAPGVEKARSLTGLWGEFMHQRLVGARVLNDSAAEFAQVKHGMDPRSALRTNGLNSTPNKLPTKVFYGWISFQASTALHTF